MVRGLNIDGRGSTVQGRGVDVGEVGPSGFATGFETPGDWTYSGGSDGGIETSGNNQGPRSGTYALYVGNDVNGYATYNSVEALFAEFSVYYSANNDDYYNFTFLVREQGAGGDALAVSWDATAGSGDVRLMEGSVSSGWNVLTSTSHSVGGFGTNSYFEVTGGIYEGASSGDAYGEISLAGTTITTSDATPTITSAGRIGFGMADLSNTGGDNWWDDETISVLG